MNATILPNIRFLPVSSDAQLQILATLAEEIWGEYYTPILGTEQVKYMLANYQSFDALKRQIFQERFSYHLLVDGINAQNLGYLAWQVQGQELFISKLYVVASARGQRIGATAMLYIREQARSLNCTSFRLTVNKQNRSAIAFYESQGFKRVQDQITPIGAGFVMDDYVYSKSL